MAAKQKKSEAQILENYRVALENSEKLTIISTKLAEYGYTKEKLTEGKALLQQTRKIYDENKNSTIEKLRAYTIFDEKKEKLDNTYRNHRKRAKVLFSDETAILEKLGIKTAIPRTYTLWLEKVKIFYTYIQNNEEIKTQLVLFKITSDDIEKTLLLIDELEQNRVEYLEEKGKSQNYTKNKNNAFTKLNKWMNYFYSVAKIALEDNPQLLEALAKIIK